MLSSLMLRRSPSADQADPLASNSMNHNQQTSLVGLSDNHKALFVTTVVGVGDRNRKRVVKDASRLDKSDAALPLIRRLPSPIPLKRDSIHLPSSLPNRKASRAEQMTAADEVCPDSTPP